VNTYSGVAVVVAVVVALLNKGFKWEKKKIFPEGRKELECQTLD
jgi:hypothetical protein